MLDLSHKQLEVYKIALLLVNEIYRLTNVYPKQELFTLVSQLRRASISVCSNLAEGAARKSPKEKKRFYEMARSSVVEIDTQIEVSLQLNYLIPDQTGALEKYLESVFKMLSKIIANIELKNPLATTH